MCPFSQDLRPHDAWIGPERPNHTLRVASGRGLADAGASPGHGLRPGHGRLGTAAGLVAYSVRPNLYHGGPAGAVEELLVREGARRRGIGSMLLRRVLDHFDEAGCVEVTLSTDLGNDAAQALYRRLGLTEETLELSRHRGPRTDTAVAGESTES